MEKKRCRRAAAKGCLKFACLALLIAAFIFASKWSASALGVGVQLVSKMSAEEQNALQEKNQMLSSLDGGEIRTHDEHIAGYKLIRIVSRNACVNEFCITMLYRVDDYVVRELFMAKPSLIIDGARENGSTSVLINMATECGSTTIKITSAKAYAIKHAECGRR